MRLIKFLAGLAFIVSIKASMDVKVILHDQNRDRTEHKGDSCDTGLLFEEPQDLRCACVTGVWAFYGVWCTRPGMILSGSNFCFQLPRGKTSQVSLLSSAKSMFSSTLARMTPGLEQLKEKVYQDSAVSWDMSRTAFVTTGEDSWELRTLDGKSYCLRTVGVEDFYCIFGHYELPEELHSGNVTKVKRGCSAQDVIDVKPFKCFQFNKGNYGEERTCAEIEAEDLRHSHRPFSYDFIDDSSNLAMGDTDIETAKLNTTKRYNPNFAMEDVDLHTAKSDTLMRYKRQTPSNPGPVEDEDWIDPEQSAVINHPLVLQQLRAYLDDQIASTAGATTQYVANVRGIPAFILLQQSLVIMKQTCNVVESSFFDIAFNAFTNIQVQSYHVKEPYLTQPQFLRIQEALAQCSVNAKHHNFVGNETLAPNITTNSTLNITDMMSFPNDTNTCEGVVLPEATNVTEKGNYRFNLTFDNPATRGTGYEPIIEAVWKIFLNAHSYCYKFFSDYYNDHHSYSVALLSLFTNEIQNIWFNTSFPNGTYVEPAEGLLLYGGIIGPHRKLIDSIDLCVAASRIGSPYPWFMNRPPLDASNKWVRRRKRSVANQPSCLKTPKATAELYSEIGYGRCD